MIGLAIRSVMVLRQLLARDELVKMNNQRFIEEQEWWKLSGHNNVDINSKSIGVKFRSKKIVAIKSKFGFWSKMEKYYFA